MNQPIQYNNDICYGPIAPGQFFIDRLNPHTPIIFKTTAIVTSGVMYCDVYIMNEECGGWYFGVNPNGRGVQVAVSNLEQKERVSCLNARLFSERELRRRDDEWRKQYAPTREPIKINRCRCGVGDDAPLTMHSMGCFLHYGD